MVRQNENDVRCTGGNLITRPLSVPLSARTGRGEERKFLLFFEEGGRESDLLHLAVVVPRRLIADESANDSIITATNFRDKFLSQGVREGVGAGG